LTGKQKLVDELVDLVKIDRFIEAIEKNDYYLARANFELIVPFLRKYLPAAGFPLTSRNIDKFMVFCDTVNKKGLGKFLPDDIVSFWCKAQLIEFDVWLDRQI